VVGDHKPVDPVGRALDEDEPDDPTDVVDDKRKAVEVRLVDEALQVVGVARKRVLELLRLGSPKPGRSGAMPPVRSRNGRQIHDPTGFPCGKQPGR
jgi:hypothetical protein